MNFASILNDVTLWLFLKNNNQLVLASYQKIAISRWTWIVENINTFGWNIETETKRKEQLTHLLKDVESYKKDNQHNPMKYHQKFFQYQPLLMDIPINRLNPLSQKEQEVINNRNKEILALTARQFRDRYNFLDKELKLASRYVNLNNDDTIKVDVSRDYIFQDLELMRAGIELLEIIEQILLDFKHLTGASPNLILNAQNNLEDNSDISFNTSYKSAIAVPFEESLDYIARNYLGSADRWLELVAINELRPPYVDFKGTKVILNSNAVNNTFQINSFYRDFLSVGQKIYIGSSRYKQKQAIVINNIQQFADTISVTANKDISKYKKQDMSYILYYKPHTIQENSFILIPSETVISSTKMEYNSQEIRRLDKTLREFGSDLYVDEADDWKITNNDLTLVYGVPAIKQTINEILKTPLKDNKWHPDYGIVDNIGSKFISFDQATSLALMIQSSAMKDTRFSNVVVNNIVSQNNSILINMTVYVKGLQRGIPLSFIG